MIDNQGKNIALRFFKEYLSPNWKLVFAAMLCSILASACTVAVVKLVKPIIDDVFVSKMMKSLVRVSIYFLSISILKGISEYGEAIFINKLWNRILSKLQIRCFSHLMRADLSYFHSSPSGTLVSKLNNDINILKNIVTLVINGVTKDIFTVIGIIGVMLFHDFYLSLAIILGFSCTVLPTLKIGKKVRNISSTRQNELGTWVSFLTQSFQGIRMIKSYNMEDFEITKAKNIIRNLFSLSMKTERTKAIIHPIMELLIGIAVSLIVLFGGWLVIKGYKTPGTLLSFITALIMVYKPVKNISNSNSTAQEGIASLARLYAILDIAPSIVSKPNAPQISLSHGEIKFDNVSFGYSPSKKLALKNFNLHIEAGKVVAIVGHSGAGKSTLINLIPRFFDVSEGRILIDGQDIRDVNITSLRHSISLVSQEVVLFNDNIYQNIIFGNPHATVEDVENAAKLAAAFDFINALPNKFDTEIGENGVTLSGGQRQRISIARAILKNAPILLLDEATSSLDSQSEKEIQNALNKLMKNKTTIIVAHRLSTIMAADEIIVLDEGNIVERGQHSELLLKNGIYAKLYNTQRS